MWRRELSHRLYALIHEWIRVIVQKLGTDGNQMLYVMANDQSARDLARGTNAP